MRATQHIFTIALFAAANRTYLRCHRRLAPAFRKEVSMSHCHQCGMILQDCTALSESSIEARA
jgi:hypothetical protein